MKMHFTKRTSVVVLELSRLQGARECHMSAWWRDTAGWTVALVSESACTTNSPTATSCCKWFSLVYSVSLLRERAALHFLGFAYILSRADMGAPSSSSSQWFFPVSALQWTPSSTTSSISLDKELYDRARGIEFLYRLGVSLQL